jgi:hypothetical protein
MRIAVDHEINQLFIELGDIQQCAGFNAGTVRNRFLPCLWRSSTTQLLGRGVDALPNCL